LRDIVRWGAGKGTLRTLDGNVTAKSDIGNIEWRARLFATWQSRALAVGQRPLGRTSPQRARFEATSLGTVCVLGVKGEVDLFNSPALELAIANTAQRHEGIVLVSFVDCTFADCSSLGVLIRQHRTLGPRLVIVAPPKSALGRILDITKLTSALPAHGSLREAYLWISSYPRESLGDLAMWVQAR